MNRTEIFLLKLGRTIAASRTETRAPVPVLADELSRMSGEEVTAGAIYNWCERDRIAYRLRPFVAQLGVRENVDLPKSLTVFAPAVSA